MRRLFPDRDAEARLAEQRDRFTSLLDVLGEHVYLALVLEDGTIKEIFQGPGADRLLGGAEPDEEMANWEAALHPDDRAAYDAFNEQLSRGEPAEVEYRLRGADGVTRWVHDRAATRRRDDGVIEISGIVSDVTERRRMRAEEKAHRLPVLLSIPLVACMLPAMIGVLMLPAAIRVVRAIVPALGGGG